MCRQYMRHFAGNQPAPEINLRTTPSMGAAWLARCRVADNLAEIPLSGLKNVRRNAEDLFGQGDLMTPTPS